MCGAFGAVWSCLLAYRLREYDANTQPMTYDATDAEIRVAQICSGYRRAGYFGRRA